jgi:hypothetical protein
MKIFHEKMRKICGGGSPFPPQDKYFWNAPQEAGENQKFF